MNNKFEYFLNALHYNLYLAEVWTNKAINRLADKSRAMKCRLPFIYKDVQIENKKRTKEMNDFLYSDKTGLSICFANHWLKHFYACYTGFFSFVLLGLLFRFYGEVNHLIIYSVVAVPIILGYIPAYKAVFAKNRYLKYFKQFAKEDTQWHKKWKVITFAFCIGSIVMILLGVGTMLIVLSV